jgi:very-short-patch-repair endonuclease
MSATVHRPMPLGAIVEPFAESLGVGGFMLWASRIGFTYPKAAHHLFCKCASAAEVYFLLPFVERDGVGFSSRGAIWRDVRVYPQHSIGGFKTDFGVHGGALWLAVEVDGMAFHRENADQVARDYARQRRIVAAGYSVLRFTAQEAFSDARACWRELDEILGVTCP